MSPFAVSAMPLKYRSRSWSIWQTVFTLTLPVLLGLVAVHGTSCVPPCNMTLCEPPDCEYGIVPASLNSPCHCCPGCGLGPDQRCAGPARLPCGTGLYCLITSSAFQAWGKCVVSSSAIAPSSPAIASPSPSSLAASPTPSPTPIPAPTSPTQSTTEKPTTIRPTATNPGTGCRQKCSVDFCSGGGSGKTKICSAQELADVRVEGRGSCQHTSCKSCFLLLEPQCNNTRCEEPPSKRCLRQYYECIRNHYFDSPPERILLELEDPEARTAPGRVICHVPAVLV